MPPPDPSPVFRFQGWELRPQERVLLVTGRPVAIGARAFDLLLALVQRPGRVVSRGELLQAAWHGLVVQENNVAVQVATLRKRLGSAAIKTVAARGYRLAAVPAEAAQPADDEGLIGRDADLQALRQLRQDHALVTVTGIGGIGKTALARALVAGEGAVWVDLAPLREPSRLAPMLASALGVDLVGAEAGDADLVAALARRGARVVLDNCEHLLDAVAGLLRVALPGAPGLRWLATSQAALRLPQEQVYRLQPLPVPPAGTPLPAARRSGALALLCRRVQKADRAFELTTANQDMASELCRQIDGLPLAIEMAAALVASVGLGNVHRQLGQRLRALSGPPDAPQRHQRLQGTLDWAHELLSQPERKLLRRLAPCVGGFSATLACRLASDPEPGPRALEDWQVLPALAALVERSLVQRSRDGGDRFMLLESTRDYAAWRLALAGEAALIERRHAHVVADLLEPLRADWEVLRDEDWIARYRPERPNARAALGHAMRAEEPDLLARLVAAMGLIDAFDNDHPEIAALPLPMALLGQALPSCRGPALLELSWAHQGIGRRDRGIDCAQRALADFNAVGDSAGACRALAQLVRLHESRPGGRDEARQALAAWRAIDAGGVPQRTRLWCRIMAGMQYGGERTLDGLRDLEDAALRCGFDGLVAVSRLHITDQLLVEGRDDEVLQATEACLQAGEPRPRVKATLLHNRAQALLRLGRLAQARDTEVAALHARGRLSLMSLSTLVLVAAREGRHRDAATIAGWMQRELHARGLLPDPVDAAFFDEAEALLRAALPAPRLAELMRAGAALPAAALLAQVTAEPASLVETELRRVV